ncbi:MAG: L-seryl-tRNA(Sec) selenium transferase [Planctomycetes bacterium]|nr:L-seryl-tRNA(Sec) selenium transferase [Planctomycetota bacterium]MCW8136882.1 L-seryl-tRNA(Sec) selenium transferase [Planctomycetota bacterium]
MSKTATNIATPRDLPKLDALLGAAPFAALIASSGRDLVTEETRLALDALRREIRDGNHVFLSELAPDALAVRVQRRLERMLGPIQCRVINATGVILHTSLGRAPLPPSAVEAAAREAAGYSCLELDRGSGKRSDRDKLVNALIERVTGAEAATVVNNNAAATMIILNSLADGAEVVCSRAHMVEIGGSYRMPDVMRKAGCKLVEVGCTNKTKARDFEDAITEHTAMLLKVHTSNYAIVGFTEEPSLEELVEIGRRRNIPVVYDLGAGSLVDLKPYGITREPSVPDLVATGADLVCFSGDKLLGGPQAGIIVGRTGLVQRIKKNALFRMMRCDKFTLSLLEHTLKLYLDASTVTRSVPTLAAIARPAEQVAKLARSIAGRLAKRGITATLANSTSQIGGGSTPGEELPTTVLVIDKLGGSPDAAAKRLRMGTPSVFCRIENDALVFDPRTLLPGQDAELVNAIAAAKQA